MQLPVMPPVKPMLAKPVAGIPDPAAFTGGLLFEPKWDGFRCVAFRDGDEVELGSRNERPLTRYFPEIVAAVLQHFPERAVIDGEIILARGDVLDFDTLQNRLHPAKSRVDKLAAETPAGFVAFDLLAVGDEDLTSTPFAERRARLEAELASAQAPIFVTPVTRDLDLAGEWFSVFEGAGLDGLVAKPGGIGYRQNQRVMLKVKHQRTADCVVAGFRWHTSGPVVGSLLLGLYAGSGESRQLQHVGVCGAFSAARRKELVDELAPYRTESLAGHPWAEWASAEDTSTADRRPGAVSRWNANKDLSWVALRPELVCEVAYEHMQGDRFRHTAQFRRWRPDRDPESCDFAQLEQVVAYDLASVLAGAPA
jgi:ATP-dependent DNA ligase